MSIGEVSMAHEVGATARPSGRRLWGLMASAAVVAAMIVPLSVLGSSSVAGAAAGATSCGGPSMGEPAFLAAGTYSSLNVTGICFVAGGAVTITGDATVQPGAGLFAVFSKNEVAGSGLSSLTVQGNVNILGNGTALLGCENPAFPCFDDPNATSGVTIGGSIEATSALGVIVHASTIGNDIVQTGGGGGNTCNPSGVFADFGAPVYSDYEDNTLGGNLRVTGLTSCWFGAIRNTIGGSFTYANNTFNDPDASENLTNTIAGNMLCSGNNPASQYGDSGGSPNTVGGFGTGECAFGVLQPDGANSGTPTPIAVPNPSAQGYWLAAADGGIFSYGVPFFGSQSGTALAQPIAGMAAVPGGGSYDLVEGNGTVFGNGPHASDCASVSGLNKPVVGIASAPGGNGCWLAASDGGVFAQGSNAPFFGSAGALPLVKPVVGIAATPNNDGYDLVASDGGIFTYGPGAQFFGSMGGKPLNQPIVGIAVDPATGGYWEVAKDGGIFAFNAPFFGSMGGKPLNQPIVGMAAAPGGDGYYLVASDGGIFTFGTGAHFQGSTGSLHLVKPIVGMSLG
jgi:hypothetical protein